ncbi:MAG: hypothetical protein MJ070_01970 [Lachnospiraceae bacterium]|nr:hypothetical protein [Lachnospiraceae bacterium]
MTYPYEIAGVRVSFESPFAIADGKRALPFRKETSRTDILCTLGQTEGFGKAKGTLLVDDYLSRLYLDGTTLTNDRISSPGGAVRHRARFGLNVSGVIPVTTERTAAGQLTGDDLWAMIDLPFQLSFFGTVVLHSAAVDIGGRVLLFCAPSGTGKSTQSALWEKIRGAVPLNGDKNALRLWEKTPFAFGLPFSGSSRSCRNYALPIAAIAVLSQAKQTQVRRLHGVGKITALLPNCVGHSAVPGTGARTVRALTGIAERIPVFHLACTPDEAAVRALEKVLP